MKLNCSKKQKNILLRVEVFYKSVLKIIKLKFYNFLFSEVDQNYKKLILFRKTFKSFF